MMQQVQPDCDSIQEEGTSSGDEELNQAHADDAVEASWVRYENSLNIPRPAPPVLARPPVPRAEDYNLQVNVPVPGDDKEENPG